MLCHEVPSIIHRAVWDFEKKTLLSYLELADQQNSCASIWLSTNMSRLLPTGQFSLEKAVSATGL
jgi:hypothetical protein